jgi:tripartite-type tricarboxylate transporter receptor subunit TctC
VFIPAPAGIEYLRNGRLRALGISSATRFEALPDVPSVGEFVSGYEASTWDGVAAPRNTSATIIDSLNKEINAGLAQPILKARFAELGAEVFPGSPSDLSRLVVAETEKWGKVIRAAICRHRVSGVEGEHATSSMAMAAVLSARMSSSRALMF